MNWLPFCTAGQLFDVAGMDIDNARINFHGRIDSAKTFFGGNRLGNLLARIGLLEQRLPLKIRFFDDVAIRQTQKSNARPHKLIGNRRAQRAASNQQYARFRQPVLSGLPDLRQQSLAMVTHGIKRLARATSPIIVADLTRIRMPADTQQIMDEAVKLGKLVAQHPAIARYKEARRAVDQDAEATRMLGEMDRQIEALTRQAQAGMPVTDAQQQQLETLQNRIVSHIKIKALNLAQMEFVDLLRKVSQTIQRQVADVPQEGQPAAAAGGGGGPRISGLSK